MPAQRVDPVLRLRNYLLKEYLLRMIQLEKCSYCSKLYTTMTLSFILVIRTSLETCIEVQVKIDCERFPFLIFREN